MANKRSKRYASSAKALEAGALTLSDAVKALENTQKAKFDETG